MFTSQERRMSHLSFVNISPLEIELIRQWVSDISLQESLIEIFNRLFAMDKREGLRIYTDGSLINAYSLTQDTRVAMGAGWILEDSNISFQYGVESFPSLTRSELMAILTALLAVPLSMKVTVFTDSQAAIDRIKEF